MEGIKVNLDLMMVKRGMSLTELADEVGITLANLSKLKTGKARAIRFSTLYAICKALDCTPGDLLALAGTSNESATKQSEKTHVAP